MTTPPTSRRRPDLPTLAWPLGLLLLLVALATWRAAGEEPAAGGVGAAPTAVATRTFAGIAIGIPPAWRALDRTADHATWGSADRRHTVTVARIEQSAAPLPAVLRALAQDAGSAVPGAAVVGSPIELELQDAPRGDVAMLVRFEVADEGHAPVQVAQVWRRDSRAGIDAVATWTSTDGRWPVSPRDSIPEVSGIAER